MYILLGKSGSGKSTLLNIIGCLDKADSGEILYNGQSLQGFSANDMDDYRNVTVGFVFQEFNLFEQFNVYENIELVLKMHMLEGVYKSRKNLFDENWDGKSDLGKYLDSHYYENSNKGFTFFLGLSIERAGSVSTGFGVISVKAPLTIPHLCGKL